MQFLVMDPGAEPNKPLSPEKGVEMGKFMSESYKAGIVVANGGLPPKGSRIKLHNGKISITDGPFVETKEMVLGFAVIQVDSREEAVKWTTRLREFAGEGETSLIQVYGPS